MTIHTLRLDKVYPSMFAFVSLGPVELVVIGGIALLLFGNRLPSVMRSLGQGITEFKRGMHEVGTDEDEDASKKAHIDDSSTTSKP